MTVVVPAERVPGRPLSIQESDVLTPRRPSRSVLAAAVAAPVLLAQAALAAPASAAGGTVTSLSDSGPGSLRDALAAAAAGDTITVGVTGTVALASPLTIAVPVTVVGPGSASFVLSGGSAVRVLDVTAAGTTTLRGLTVTDGSAASASGGGVHATGADLVLQDVVVRDSATTGGGTGGGIDLTGGSLTLRSSAVTGNTGDYYGGGISTTDAAVTITDSVVEGNTAGNAGGAVSMRRSGGSAPRVALVVVRSTVRDNHAQAVPGLYNGSGAVDVEASTLSGNTGTISPGVGIAVQAQTDLGMTNSTVTGGGGGVLPTVLYAGPSMQLDHVTVTGNGATTTTAQAAGPLVVDDSILVGATGDDLQGGTVSVRHTLVGRSAAVSDGVDGNLVGEDPQLGALADNGGPTRTLLPAPGSPVVDAGSNPYTATTADQRGSVRVVDGTGDGVAVTDMGAVEAGPTSGAPVSPVPPSGTGGSVPGTVGAPELAATGVDTHALLPLGASALLLGGVLTVAGARRRRS